MKKFWISSVIGITAGFLNGLFGSGGGSIAVPAMQKFLKIETHKSHATAVAVILALSVVSVVVYLINGKVDDWTAVLYVSAGGLAGGFIGAKLLNKIPTKLLHKIFGVCLIAAAVRMIF